MADPSNQSVSDVLITAVERAQSLGLAAEAMRIKTLAEEAAAGEITDTDKADWLAVVLTILGDGEAASHWHAVTVADHPHADAEIAQRKVLSAIAACDWHAKRLQGLAGGARLAALDIGVALVLSHLLHDPLPTNDIRLLGVFRQIAGLALGASWRQSHLIAEVMLPRLRHAAEAGAVPFMELKDDINTAWHLVWSSAWGLERLLSLDPFVELLAGQARQQLGTVWQRKQESTDEQKNQAWRT